MEPDPPAPPPAASSGPPGERTRTDFPCENCGAPTVWDPDADALACEHCGRTREVPRAAGAILERPLADAGAAARGLGLAKRLVGAVEDEARRRGLHAVRLGVRIVLTENQRLFASLGYREIAREAHPGFDHLT